MHVAKEKKHYPIFVLGQQEKQRKQIEKDYIPFNFLIINVTFPESNQCSGLFIIGFPTFQHQCCEEIWVSEWPPWPCLNIGSNMKTQLCAGGVSVEEGGGCMLARCGDRVRRKGVPTS